MFQSYIALGDSFTEGIGDWYPDGNPRGWADRVAQALATQYAQDGNSEPFAYANLAIRGRKLIPVIEEQLEPAIAQRPDIISLNAGGNDMLRPGFDATIAVSHLMAAVERLIDANIHVLLLAGPDPSANLPMGSIFYKRATIFVDEMMKRAKDLESVTFVDNFRDKTFADTTFWSEDGLHLSTEGHLLVAANCLDQLGVPYPTTWGEPRSPLPQPKSYKSTQYMNTYVVPWIGRRLTGRSSGDGRIAKRPTLRPFDSKF